MPLPPLSYPLEDLGEQLRSDLGTAVSSISRTGTVVFVPSELRVVLASYLRLLRTVLHPEGALFVVLPGIGSVPGLAVHYLTARLPVIGDLPISAPAFQIDPALGEARGVVLRVNDDPLPGMSVGLFRGTHDDVVDDGVFPVTTTNWKGRFEFEQVPPEPWTIVIRSTPLLPWVDQPFQEIDLSPGESMDLEFRVSVP